MARRKKSAQALPPPTPSGIEARAEAPAVPQTSGTAAARDGSTAPAKACPRILIVASSRLLRARIAARLEELEPAAECHLANCTLSARTLAAHSRFDAAFIAIEPDAADGLDIVRDFSEASACPPCIILAENASLDLAVAAMRRGAVDLISTKATPAELGAALRLALTRSRAVQHREARIDRLTRVCRKLNDARHEVTEQVSSLCGDLVTAYQELADQIADLGTASEFNSLIRQELDVESVLRTALEYILAQTGPTNAAIFLPGNGSSGGSGADFTLGAYVNYDVSKDMLDMVLEHLASFVPPRLEAENELKIISGAQELHAFFGDEAHWLGDSRAVAFACHHQGECLAAAILFRDGRNPFPEAVISTLRIVAALFGRQLARVIHIHHRHLPKDQWNGFCDDGDDDIDLAA
jgi:DNA-binding response OmpR family regulator